MAKTVAMEYRLQPSCTEGHEEKTEVLKRSVGLPTSTYRRLVQPEKAEFPTEVTASGRDTLSSWEQPKKAELPIAVREEGRLTLRRAGAWKKAYAGILATPSGIVTEARLEQLWKMLVPAVVQLRG